MLALTLDPDFTRTGHVFVIHAPPGVFRMVRYRLAGGALVDRTPLIRDVPAAADPSATLRAGPDGKLYAAFDDGGRPRCGGAAFGVERQDSADEHGRQHAGRPAGGVAGVLERAPRAARPRMDADGATLWMAEHGLDGMDRIGALVTGPERPRRASQRVTYTLPQSLGARSLVLHRGESIS